MSVENQQEEQLTPEELMRRRMQMIEYFKNQIEVLKLQAEFQKLKAEIEESALKEISCVIKRSQLLAGPQQEKEAVAAKENQPVAEPTA